MTRLFAPPSARMRKIQEAARETLKAEAEFQRCRQARMKAAAAAEPEPEILEEFIGDEPIDKEPGAAEYIPEEQPFEEQPDLLPGKTVNGEDYEEPERAREPDGTFKADDPSTPDVDEAWVDGEGLETEMETEEKPEPSVWNSKMRKAKLLNVAEFYGLSLTMDETKKEIIKELKKAERKARK